MKKGFDKEEAKMCMIASFNADRDKKGVWYCKTNDPGDYAFIEKNQGSANSPASYVLAFHGTDFNSQMNVKQVSEIYKFVSPSFKITTKLNPKVSVAVNSAFCYFKESLTKYLQTLPENVDFFVTGHSEGGAIASIITLFIATTFPGKFNLKTYTYAPPTAGNEDFKTLTEAASSYGFYRVVNPNDIVPYFNDQISTVLKNNIPIKIPVAVAFVYQARKELLDVLGLKYVSIGETHLLPKKTFSQCITSPDLQPKNCNTGNLSGLDSNNCIGKIILCIKKFLLCFKSTSENNALSESSDPINTYICYTRCAHYPTTYLTLMGIPIPKSVEDE